MRRRRLWSCFVTVLTATWLSAPALGAGQWINYPTAGVPKRADGSPDLTAAAPRHPNGKPDFSGLWRPFNPRRCTVGGGEFVECGLELGGSPAARNIGALLPGGLPYQPWAAALVKARDADHSRDDPHVRCLPDNPPRTWTLPHLTKVLHSPTLMALLYEVNAMYRQVFIDGRPFPEDPTPTWNGYSVAEWEGDTLVVRTMGFRDDLWLDMVGSPMSSAARMTERLRRPDFGTLEVEVTVDDPKTYTRPWTVKLQQELALNLELIDEFCLENEKSYERMLRSRPAQ
jgi:hypothetical protein